MKRILPFTLLLASAVVTYACSKSNDSPAPTPEPLDTEPATGEDAGTPPEDEAGTVADTGPAPGSEDPSGNPILLGPARVVRTFTPAGGEPDFVDGPQWSEVKSLLYVSLPLATNLTGGKGVLTSFKADGTNYIELRAGDTLTTGVVGNSVDNNGNLISAELRVITRTDAASGGVTVIASGYGRAGEPVEAGVEGGVPGNDPFNAPNDLIALADGTIYFTDPGYGIEPRPLSGYLGRISFAGGLATADRADTYDNNPSPNGIALSTDQKSLYVGFTAPAEGTLPYVRKYSVNVDHSLTDLGKYLEVPIDSVPDGMAMDSSDNLYVALKTGIAVYKTTGANGEPYGGAGAKVPQTLVPGEPSNLTFGGADRKSLFITTKDGKVLELRTKVAGLVQ
jgi:gluconolactonase